ncbi:MAG: DUF3313 domain-containing protein [bacterium]
MRLSTIKPHGRGQFGVSWAGFLVLAIALSSCATTRQPRQAPEQSGFLGDYSMLKEGEGDQAALVYIDPAVDFAKYDAVIIDSVSFWTESPEGIKGVTPEEQKALTDYTYEALHRELGEVLNIVTIPGPDVMRLRVALTEAKGARVASKTVTTVVPQLRLLTTLGGMASDTAVTVGSASMEVDVTDSMTNKRIAAAADERWGTKTLRGGLKKWSDAKNAIDYWAERMRARVEELRGGDKEIG